MISPRLLFSHRRPLRDGGAVRPSLIGQPDRPSLASASSGCPSLETQEKSVSGAESRDVRKVFGWLPRSTHRIGPVPAYLKPKLASERSKRPTRDGELRAADRFGKLSEGGNRRREDRHERGHAHPADQRSGTGGSRVVLRGRLARRRCPKRPPCRDRRSAARPRSTLHPGGR